MDQRTHVGMDVHKKSTGVAVLRSGELPVLRFEPLALEDAHRAGGAAGESLVGVGRNTVTSIGR